MKRLIALAASVLILSASGCQQARVKPDTQNTQYLFVQTAPTGSLKLLDESKGLYLLSLRNVATSTVYFSERPARKTGQVSTEAFLTRWSLGENSFIREPPNAALDFLDESRHNRLMVVVPDPADKKVVALADISGLDRGKPAPLVNMYNLALFIDQQSAPGCNENDAAMGINAGNTLFKSQMDSCAKSSLAIPGKTAGCITRAYPSLSKSCSACFGKMVQCMASHCSHQCIVNHFSDSCRSCASTECVDPATGALFSLTGCTGLRHDQLPP